jgi:hypothetical protein
VPTSHELAISESDASNASDLRMEGTIISLGYTVHSILHCQCCGSEQFCPYPTFQGPDPDHAPVTDPYPDTYL